MREQIIVEIKKLAASKGKPPGQAAFFTETGIAEHLWRGKIWARWGDALTAAGFLPNSWTEGSDPEVVLFGLAQAVRHYGRWPTTSELALLRNADFSIPHEKVVRRLFGTPVTQISALIDLALKRPELTDILSMLPERSIHRPEAASPTFKEGWVYLLKSGHFYKIGRSDEIERRVKEIKTALPDKADLIHAIRTDDPSGIEAYWHQRFQGLRANGEWFRLTVKDVAAFRKRKFQ